MHKLAIVHRKYKNAKYIQCSDFIRGDYAGLMSFKPKIQTTDDRRRVPEFKNILKGFSRYHLLVVFQ